MTVYDRYAYKKESTHQRQLDIHSYNCQKQTISMWQSTIKEITDASLLRDALATVVTALNSSVSVSIPGGNSVSSDDLYLNKPFVKPS